MGSTLSLQWLCKIPFSQPTSFQLTVLIAGRFPMERQKKKSVEPRSREKCRANLELSFGLGSTLSLQWLCKIPFSQLTLFQLTVLIAGRFPLERQKKKSVETRYSAGQIQSYPSKWVRHYTTMIVQNTIFTTNFFWMDSFDGRMFPLGDAENKICWTT